MSQPDPRGLIFIDPALYADQDAWHAAAAELRADAPVLRVEEEGYTPFWAVTRHEDVFRVVPGQRALPQHPELDPRARRPVRVPQVHRHRGRDPHPHGRRGARRPPRPGQRLVPAACRGQAPGGHRRHRRRVRRQVPPARTATATSPRTSPCPTRCG